MTAQKTTYSRPSAFSASADAIPILVDGTYHIFHLTTPPSTRHHPPRLRSSWSRIRSTNLVSWTRDPSPILQPSNDPSAPDADGAWTGSAVIGPDGRMNLFYTGYNLLRGGKQVILRTESSDRDGSSFPGPASPIAILGDLSTFEDIDFRDPYVFYNDAEACYWMLVATRLRQGPHWTRGCVALLTSPGLEFWTLEPEPLYSPNDLLCPECPEMFALAGRWYLVYSRLHGPDAGTVYRVADSPRGPFRVPRDGSGGRLDGRRWYAAKSCPRAGNPDQRVYFGWVGDYVDDEGKWLWGGDLGLPRVVSADKEGYLRVEVAPELNKALRARSSYLPKAVVSSKIEMSTVGTTVTQFPELGFEASTRDLVVSFGVGACDANSFGMLLQAYQTDKAYRLSFRRNLAGSPLYDVALLTDLSPLDDFWADQYQLYLPRGVDGPELVAHRNVKLDGGVTVHLRGQLVEVFCGGRSLSFRLPLPGMETRRFGWFVEDGTVSLRSVSARVCESGII